MSSKPYTRPLNLLLLRPPSPMNLEELQIEVEEGFSQVKIAKCYALGMEIMNAIIVVTTFFLLELTVTL